MDLTWRTDAACRGRALEPFFTDPAPVEILELCRTCTVRWPCFRFGMRYSEGFGTWGGFDASERAKILRGASHTSPQQAVELAEQRVTRRLRRHAA